MYGQYVWADTGTVWADEEYEQMYGQYVWADTGTIWADEEYEQIQGLFEQMKSMRRCMDSMC